jgi:hypothetical protein
MSATLIPIILLIMSGSVLFGVLSLASLFLPTDPNESYTK